MRKTVVQHKDQRAEAIHYPSRLWVGTVICEPPWLSNQMRSPGFRGDSSGGRFFRGNFSTSGYSISRKVNVAASHASLSPLYLGFACIPRKLCVASVFHESSVQSGLLAYDLARLRASVPHSLEGAFRSGPTSFG